MNYSSCHFKDGPTGKDMLGMGRLCNELVYRANDRSQGAGLGVRTLKSAVARLNGTNQLTSSVHHGSTFNILLPLQATSGKHS